MGEGIPVPQAVILGAGPAGLTAAYLLLKETGIRPLVLEQEAQVGGLSRTVVFQGNRMDLGGHRFFSKDGDVLALWQALMPLQGRPAWDDLRLSRQALLDTQGPDPEVQDRVMLRRRRVSRIFYLRRFFDYPITMKPRTFASLGLGRTVMAGAGYLYSAARKRPEHTLEDFMINRFGAPLYHMFFEDYTFKLWGRHPSQIDASWGAQRIRGLNLLKTLRNMVQKALGQKTKEVETSLIEEFLYPKLGPGQLWETMAGEIEAMGGVILTNTQVTGLLAQGGRVTRVLARREGREEAFDADYVLSSIPVKDLMAAISPPPPPEVASIARELPYRDFITVGLLVRELKLTNRTRIPTLHGRVPDCWIYIQERNVRMGRLQIFNNWSPYLVKDPENTMFLGLEYFCNEGDDLWSKSTQDMVAYAVEELRGMGILDPDKVLDGTSLRVPKAYPAYFGSYADFGKVRAWLDGFDNLFCIGRNGQHRYNNMDHSMVCAMRAVEALKTGSRDKSPVWEVNTEESYHEAK